MYVFDNTTGYLVDIPPGVCSCFNCPDWLISLAGGFIAGMVYGVIICIVIWRKYRGVQPAKPE